MSDYRVKELPGDPKWCCDGKRYQILDPDGKIVGTYDSFQIAARLCGVHNKHLRQARAGQ